MKRHLSTHLPDYMRALVTFNQKTTWDELLSALDAAHPYVNKLQLASSQEIKTELLEAKSMNTQSREERRCYIGNGT